MQHGQRTQEAEQTKRFWQVMRYDKNTRLEAVITADQKRWLRSKAVGMRSISDVIRDLINQAIANENQHS